MTMKAPIWIFLHLSKSGGTTFNGHLSKYLSFDDELVILSGWGYTYWKTKNKRPFNRRPGWELDRVKVISGHDTYFGIHRRFENREARYVTFIRDPALRCVSLYNFKKSRNKAFPEFDQWYDRDYCKNGGNKMVRFYSEKLLNVNIQCITSKELSIAKKMIDLCWFVGHTETLDSHLGFLFSQITGKTEPWEKYRVSGQPGYSLKGLHHHQNDSERIGKFVSVTPCLREKVYADHPYDVDLFEYGITKVNHKRSDGV